MSKERRSDRPGPCSRSTAERSGRACSECRAWLAWKCCTHGEPTRRSDPIWLEPYPDILPEGLADQSPGPETRYNIKESVWPS